MPPGNEAEMKAMRAGGATISAAISSVARGALGSDREIGSGRERRKIRIGSKYLSVEGKA